MGIMVYSLLWVLQELYHQPNELPNAVLRQAYGAAKASLHDGTVHVQRETLVQKARAHPNQGRLSSACFFNSDLKTSRALITPHASLNRPTRMSLSTPPLNPKHPRREAPAVVASETEGQGGDPDLHRKANATSQEPILRTKGIVGKHRVQTSWSSILVASPRTGLCHRSCADITSTVTCSI